MKNTKLSSLNRFLAIVFVMAGTIQCSSSSAETESLASVRLHKTREFVLRDADFPIQWVSRLHFVDHKIMSVDRRTRAVRVFSPEGLLESYFQPTALDINLISVEYIAVDPDRRQIYANTSNGKIYRISMEGDEAEQFNVSVVASCPLYISPTGNLFGSRILGWEESPKAIHRMNAQEIDLSILRIPTSAAERPWKHYMHPLIAFDEEGAIFAVREFGERLHKFTEDGEEIYAIPLARNKHYRPRHFGMNPFVMTRDPSLITAWERTMTIHTGLAYVKAVDGIAVLARNNAPGQRPNTLDLYSAGDGSYLGTAEVPGYFVGIDPDSNFYFLPFDRVVDQEARVAVAQLQVENLPSRNE